MPIQNVQRGINLAGDSLATSAVFTVTASGTANTKGSYTQVFAATTFDSQQLVIQLDDITVSATNTGVLMDVAVGAGGSEQVIIANINFGAFGHGPVFVAPMFIPAGSRVAVRIQSAVVSKAVIGRINLVPASVLGDAANWCETWGAQTATSAGTTMPTPGVAGTKTAYQAITSATTRQVKWITWSVGSILTNIAAAKGGIDIAYGAAGAESLLVSNIRWEQLGTEVIRAAMFVVPCCIPAGSRIAARWDSSSTAGTSVIGLVVHGFS